MVNDFHEMILNTGILRSMAARPHMRGPAKLLVKEKQEKVCII